MFGKKKFKRVETPTEDEPPKLPELPKLHEPPEFVDEYEDEEEIEEENMKYQPKGFKRGIVGVPKIKEEPKGMTVVVKELPVQEVRSMVRKDGTKINFVTVEEALTEIYNSE